MGLVAFLSPQHAFRERWVDREYERFPHLLTSSTKRLLDLGRARDARRDEEARLAGAMHTNSALTKESLVKAGYPEGRIVAVPLGSPPAIAEELLPTSLPEPLRIVYSGPVSVRKGAHYLFDAWRQLRPQSGAELHCYRANLLPRGFTSDLGRTVVFHGSTPRRDLATAYQRGAVLVFPTLCDGFGAVVGEAFANGLPVVTTRNAGAADLVEEGVNGFLVPPADSQALAERIEWCIRHARELIEMPLYAIAAARRWTWADFRASLRR